MRIEITDIYRIQTMNSVYEVKVVETEHGVHSLCKKMGKHNDAQTVKEAGTDYLDRLVIGASFDVPGVVLTSVVQDYTHYVLSDQPKRRLSDYLGVLPGLSEGEAMGQWLAEQVIGQVKGKVRVIE